MALKHALQIWTVGVVRRDHMTQVLRPQAIIAKSEQELKDELVKCLMYNYFNPDEMNKLTIDEMRDHVSTHVLIGHVSVQELWFADGIEVINVDTTA